MIQTMRGNCVTTAKLSEIYRYAVARSEAREIVAQQTRGALQRIVGVAGLRIARRRRAVA